MISASTWFDPYVLEVLAIPIVIILGTILAWITRRVMIGILIHIVSTILFYIWFCIYFYAADPSQFFAVHMNDFESYIIHVFFIGMTWLLSWRFVKSRKKKFN
jgi:hypothetical protein